MFYTKAAQPVDILDLYEGTEKAFLVLNGPSALQHDLEKLSSRGHLTFSLNNSTRLIKPNIWISCDRPRKFLPSTWLDPTILKFVRFRHLNGKLWDVMTQQLSDRTVNQCPNVFIFKVKHTLDEHTFLSREFIQFGNKKSRSSMLVALKIIYLLGIRKVYLLGCDFKMDRERPYFFNEPVSDQSFRHNNTSYEYFIDFYTRLQPILLQSDFQVFNCNPHSNLEAFPYASFDEVVENTNTYIDGLIAKEKNTSMYVKQATIV